MRRLPLSALLGFALSACLVASGCALGSPTFTMSAPIAPTVTSAPITAAPSVPSVALSPAALAGSPQPSSTRSVADNIETVVVSEIVNYDVSGDTVPELRTEMVEKGHQGYPGYLEWFISWTFDDSGTQPCYVPYGFVTVELTTTLPHWTDREVADRSLRRRWDRFVEALAHHETGHARNVEEAAESIESMLENVSAPTCGELARVIDDLAYQELDDARQWDIAYDRRTDHGLTQGAWW